MGIVKHVMNFKKKSRTIEVPLQHEQVLEVLCNDLPQDPTELTEIFDRESVSLAFYRKLAVEYQAQGKIQESIKVIQAGLEIARQSSNLKPVQKLPLLVMIAALYLEKENWQEATRYINDANRIDSHYEHTFLVKGDYHLRRGELEDAAKAFTMLLEKNRKCVPALIGEAKVLYLSKNYQNALEKYREALKFSYGETSSMETRVGIAKCYARMGMSIESKAALKRCIELAKEPDTVALVLLGIQELNDSKNVNLDLDDRTRNLKQGLTHIQKSHEADKHNPATLNLIADHFFLDTKFDQAEASAQHALKWASSKSIKAESLYQCGRVYHAKRQYDRAIEAYQDCLNEDHGHLLAQFGKGQILIKTGKYKEAERIFESLREKEPQCIEILKIVSFLHEAEDKRARSFERFINHQHNDPAVPLEVALLYSQKQPKTALKHYQDALELIRQRDNRDTNDYLHELEFVILNNIAVIHQTLENFAEAEDYYGQAIKRFEIFQDEAKQKHSQNKTTESNITISYNIGRLYEDMMQSDKAESIYSKLIEDYPTYINAHLRLGAIYQARGRTKEAINHFRDALDIDKNNPTAWIMFALAHAATDEKMYKRSLEKVIRDCDRDDVFAHVALGNYHASVARELKSEKLKEKRKESYALSGRFYMQALKRDPSNVFAANGLAILLSDNDRSDEATQLFNRVQEAHEDNSSDWINRAHIYVEQKKFDQAIIMYKKASKKYFFNKNPGVLLYLARAQYIHGKTEKNHKEMYEALLTTQKAYQINPSDKSTMHNIALIQQSYAQLISDLPESERTYEELAHAKAGLDSSQSIFQMLVSVPKDQHVLYDRSITEQRIRFGDTLRGQLERKILEGINREQAQ